MKMRVPEIVAEDWTYIHRLKKSRGDAKILNKKVNSHQVMRHWIIGYCEYLRALLGSFDMQMLTGASEVCHSGWSMVNRNPLSPQVNMACFSRHLLSNHQPNAIISCIIHVR